MEVYRRCSTLVPVHVNALQNLALLYEDHGRFHEAESCYRKVLSADPTNVRARIGLKDVVSSQNMYYDEDHERREDRRAQVLRTPITEFELSVRSRNCLAKMNIQTLGDLVRKSEQELLAYKNFGETSLQEIKDILAQKGLRLGMSQEDDAPLYNRAAGDRAGPARRPVRRPRGHARARSPHGGGAVADSPAATPTRCRSSSSTCRFARAGAWTTSRSGRSATSCATPSPSCWPRRTSARPRSTRSAASSRGLA